MNINYQSIFAQHRLMNGLKAFWKMNDSSGNAIDQLGNINLTPVNTINYLGDSIEFPNGSSSLLYGTNISFINPFYDRFSISFWIYFTHLYSTSGHTQQVVYISRTNPPSYFMSMYVSTSNYLTFYFKTIDGGYCESHSQGFGALSTGVWYHIAGVANGIGNYSTFYINNIPLSSFSQQTSSIAHAETRIQIGGLSTGIESCARIANFGIWERSLSSSEITQLYGYGRINTYPFV